MQWNSAGTGTVTFTGSTINDPVGRVGDGVRIEGTVVLDRTGLTLNSPAPGTFWNLGPNVTVIG